MHDQGNHMLKLGKFSLKVSCVQHDSGRFGSNLPDPAKPLVEINGLCIVSLKHFRSGLDASQTRCYLIDLLRFRTLSSHAPCLIQKLYPNQKLLFHAAFFLGFICF